MTEEVGLSRRLSLPLLTLYGLGTILGAGIYVLVGKVAGQAGLYAPLSFLLAAIIAGLTGYSYARLSSRYPVSAGPARYVRIEETGGRLGFITPLTHNFCESCNRVRLTCTGMGAIRAA